MYFIADDLFRAMVSAGLEIPSSAYGDFQLAAVPGKVVNADAISTGALDGDFADRVCVFLGCQPGLRFHYDNVDGTFAGLVTIYLSAPVVADTRVETPSENRDAGATPGNARVAPRPRRSRRTANSEGHAVPENAQETRASRRRDVAEFVPITAHNIGHQAFAALSRIRDGFVTRIGRPVEIVYHQFGKVGFPEAPKEEGALQIAIGVIPEGTVLRAASRTVNYYNPVDGSPISVDMRVVADIPGMKKVEMSETTIAHYDGSRLWIHSVRGELALFLMSAWLENFVREPQMPDENQLVSMCRDFSRNLHDLMRREEDDHASVVRKLTAYQSQIVSIDAQIAALESARDALVTYPLDEAEIEQLLQAIEAGGLWKSEIENEDLVFKLASREIVDPRGGRRMLPDAVGISLTQLYANALPIAPRGNGWPDHPRLFGGDFLSDDIACAFRGLLQAKNFVGAFELAHDVITNFSLDDEDLAALDTWALVDEPAWIVAEGGGAEDGLDDLADGITRQAA